MTDAIRDNLENELAPFWSEQKDVKKENINQYFKAFSDLRYFVDRNTGKFLYARDENGQFKGLDYENIYSKSPELTILKADKTIDKEKSKKYVDEVFAKTNESFYKFSIIDRLSNDQMLHNRFGIKGRLSFDLPIMDKVLLYRLDDVSSLEDIAGRYFNNALKLVEKLAPKEYTAISQMKKEKNPLYVNSFLTVCNNNYKNVDDKDFNNSLDKNIMTIISALDNIDKEVCSQPLMKNRSTELFVNYLIPVIDEDKIFNKYATKDMKNFLKEKMEKSKR